jgi:transposase
VLLKKFTQKQLFEKQLIDFTANLETSLNGMEACSGGHFRGRALRAQGHDVQNYPTTLLARIQAAST